MVTRPGLALKSATLALLVTMATAQFEEVTCTVPAVVSVIVTALVCALIFAIIVFILKRRGKQPCKPDVEAAERAAYINPSFEADNPDVSLATSTQPGSPGAISASGLKSGEKGLSTLERVMAAVRPGSKSSLTRTLDDGRRTGGAETLVPLHATDFAGLGFTVAGTLRDGIYVKDLLNKGPAALSGKVNPGDRLVALTVVTEHCAQDDAINLLSYASPYPVLLHLVKGTSSKNSGIGLNLSSSSVTSSSSSKVQTKSYDSTVPVHPSFRSQSSGDLTKISPGDSNHGKDLRIGGEIDGPHTRISDSAIDQLTQLSRSKLQGRHSERAIDVPESALKPSSAYGKLRPGSSQDMESVTVDIEPEGKIATKEKSLNKLGVKVLPDVAIVKHVSEDETDSKEINESEKIKHEEIPDVAIEQSEETSKIDSKETVALDAEKNDAVENETFSEKCDSGVDFVENSARSEISENEQITESASENEEDNDRDVSENELKVEDELNKEAEKEDAETNTESSVPHLSYRTFGQSSYSSTTGNMMTDDEAASPTPQVDREIENDNSGFVLTETVSSITTNAPRTDDEKQSAIRNFGIEFPGMRSYMRENSNIVETPECDENKILMDTNVINVNDDALESRNRSGFTLEVINDGVAGSESMRENVGEAPNNLKFDLITNKTDQIKDEEYSANIVLSSASETSIQENSDTEDDAAMRSTSKLPEIVRTITDKISLSEKDKNKQPKAQVRRVTSPNDRSNIFGMYVNLDFEGPQEESAGSFTNLPKETGTKPKKIDRHESEDGSDEDGRSEQSPKSNESFIAARNFFTAKSEIKLFTGVPKEKRDEHSVLSSYDIKLNESEVSAHHDSDEDKIIRERKVSLLNFDLSKPKRSSFELEVKPSPVNEHNKTEDRSIEKNIEKVAVESDLPEADSDFKTDPEITVQDSPKSIHFGEAFGFKGFKKRIGRDPTSSDTSISLGTQSGVESTSDGTDIAPATVSLLKMSFESKCASLTDESEQNSLRDLPESDASFSLKLDAASPEKIVVNDIEGTNFLSSVEVLNSNKEANNKYFNIIENDGDQNGISQEEEYIETEFLQFDPGSHAEKVESEIRPNKAISVSKNFDMSRNDDDDSKVKNKLPFSFMKNFVKDLNKKGNEIRNHELSFSDDEVTTDLTKNRFSEDNSEFNAAGNDGDSFDSDEIAISRAAVAAVSNRAKTKFSKEHEMRSEHSTLNKLITGSVDVDLPDGPSDYEITEVITAENLNSEEDIVPLSLKNTDPVTVSGFSYDVTTPSSAAMDNDEKEIDKNNYVMSNLIKVKSGEYISDFTGFDSANCANHIVRLSSSDNKHDEYNHQVTVTSRKSLTDSEELKRKASSLGDLSQIPDNQEESVLERAVSLEFKNNDETNGNKIHTHRISLPNASTSYIDDVEHISVLQMNQSEAGNANIKKSAMWGTLEDAILLRHNSTENTHPGVNGHSVSVQTHRRRDYRASSLEGLPSSIGRSNSTKLMVHQPSVTVRSNPSLSLSTADLNSTKDEFQQRTLHGGPVSNIEISDGHGVSITSLMHSPWPLDGSNGVTSSRDTNGATTIRVLENYSQPEAQVLVVDTNHSSDHASYKSQFNDGPSSLTVSPNSYMNDNESEVTVTTVSGSGKTSFITGSPPDLVPIRKGSGDWGHVNGDVVRINSESNSDEMNHKVYGKIGDGLDSGSLLVSNYERIVDNDQSAPNSMTQITLDGKGNEAQINDMLSRTLVIPPPGTSAAITITQGDSPPPFLQPPY